MTKGYTQAAENGDGFCDSCRIHESQKDGCWQVGESRLCPRNPTTNNYHQ